MHHYQLMDILSDLVEDSNTELTDEQKRLLIKRQSNENRKKALESMDDKDLPLYITHPYCCEICDTSYDTWSKKTACQSKCQAELDGYERERKVVASQESNMRTSYQRPQSNFLADGLRFTFWRLVYVAILSVERRNNNFRSCV